MRNILEYLENSAEKYGSKDTTGKTFPSEAKSTKELQGGSRERFERLSERHRTPIRKSCGYYRRGSGFVEN